MAVSGVWEVMEWLEETTEPVYVRVETLAVVGVWVLVVAWAWWVFRG